MLKSLVLCDLDKTFLKVNTSFHFGKYLWKKRKLSTMRSALLTMSYLQHFLGFNTSKELHETSFELLFKGKSFAEFDLLSKAFATLIAKNEISASVEAFLHEKKKEGAHLCLLSTGPDLIVKHFGALGGFDEFIGTNYFYGQDGKFSHIGKVIDGTEKALIAKELIQQRGFEKIYALTDSIQDLPLLKVVTDPIVVNPDSRLKKEARILGFKTI